MNKENILVGSLLVLAGIAGAVIGITGCLTTETGQGMIVLEEMSDSEFTKFTQYASLSFLAARDMLLMEEVLKPEDLEAISSALIKVTETPVAAGVSSLLLPILKELNLTGSTTTLMLFALEQELIFPYLKFLENADGTLNLSTRSRELIEVVADSLNP